MDPSIRSEFRPAPPTQGPRSGGAALSRFAVPLSLFLASLGVRLLPWPSVFQPNGIVPYGGDAFYHLRRIRHAVDHYPDFLSFDPLINFPHGGQAIWPPTLDWLVAMLLRITVGPDETASLERAVMWLAPVLGALTVVVVYFLGRHFYSTRVGILAGSLLAFLPAHFQYSQLGFADHHVAISLISVGILWAAMELFASEPGNGTERTQQPARDVRGLTISACLGFVIGAGLLIWPGSLIHAGIVQLALLVRLFTSAERTTAIGWARRFVLVQAVTLIVIAPLSVGNEWQHWGSFSPLVLSNFQPLYFASAAIVVGGSALLWPRWSRCSRPLTRIAVATSIGLGLLVLLFGSIPDLRAGPLEAWTWLSRDEVFQAVVGESTPLFVDRHGFNGYRPAELFSFFLFLIPLSWLLCAKEYGARGDQKFLLWWAAAFFAATLSQRRFMASYSIAHALIIAVSIGILYRRLGRISIFRGRTHWGRSVLVGGLTLVLLAPALFSYRSHAANLIRVSRGGAPTLSGIAMDVRPMLNVARWLRENSPEPSDSEYSVLGPWDAGHLIKYVAERATVQDNFGDDVATENFDLAERYYSASDETEALALLEKTRTRYVVVQNGGSGHSPGYEITSMLAHLFFTKGSLGRVEESKTRNPVQLDALTRHRLVYESPQPSEWNSKARQRAYTGLFEIVPGALVVGHATPNAPVAIHLGLRIRNSAPFVYRNNVTADADGRYAVRVPYSNERMTPDVLAANRYQARVGDEIATFFVPEEAVLRGLEVEGPRFTPSVEVRKQGTAAKAANSEGRPDLPQPVSLD